MAKALEIGKGRIAKDCDEYYSCRRPEKKKGACRGRCSHILDQIRQDQSRRLRNHRHAAPSGASAGEEPLGSGRIGGTRRR